MARGEDHPRFLAGTPEITARQFGKFAAKTINVLGCSKQPKAVARRRLPALAQTAQQFPVEINVSEPKRAFDTRADRLKLFEYKSKWDLLIRDHLR